MTMHTTLTDVIRSTHTYERFVDEAARVIHATSCTQCSTKGAVLCSDCWLREKEGRNTLPRRKQTRTVSRPRTTSAA